MKIHDVRFFKSVFDPSQFPRPGLPEIALSGRSNVGKSSLINTLLNRKIAQTSGTPGRTQSVNFILVNHSFYFVDLPGYGYARVPERIRLNWRMLIESYLSNRSSLRCVVIIVDARREPDEDELSFVQWLDRNSIHWMLVITKIDKIPMRDHRQACACWKDFLHAENSFAFSAKTGYGKDALWKAIGSYLKKIT